MNSSADSWTDSRRRIRQRRQVPVIKCDVQCENLPKQQSKHFSVGILCEIRPRPLQIIHEFALFACNKRCAIPS